MKSISQCIADKDWKGLSLCTRAGIINKKKLEGQKADNLVHSYVADKSKAPRVYKTRTEVYSRGRV